MSHRRFQLMVLLLAIDLASTLFLGLFFTRRTANRQPAIQILNELARERRETDRQRGQNTDLLAMMSLTTTREIHLQNQIKALKKELKAIADFEKHIIELKSKIEELKATIEGANK